MTKLIVAFRNFGNALKNQVLSAVRTNNRCFSEIHTKHMNTIHSVFRNQNFSVLYLGYKS
jgi:hypothetical protein